MKLIQYEMKKVLSMNIIRIGILVFMIINAFVCIYKTSYIEDMPPINDVLHVFQMAKDTPGDVKDIYRQLQEEQEQRITLYEEQLMLGNDPDGILESVNTYTTSDIYDDIDIFNILFNEINVIATYPDTLSSIIMQANRNLNEYQSMNISEDTYVYRLQEKTIDIYDELKDTVQIGLDYQHGWSDYFANTAGNVCVFIVLLIISSVIFTEEYRSGVLPIIRVSRFGRTKTANAKLVTLLLMTIGVVLLFSFETFIIIGLRIGYSNPLNALQSLAVFRLCPYNISIISYFLLNLLLKILTFALFSVFVVFVSVFVYQYSIVYLAGIGYMCGNLLLNNISYYNGDNVFKVLNIINTTSANYFFTQYRAFNMFGHVIDYTVICISTYLFLIALLSAFCVWRYNINANVVRSKLVQSVIGVFKNLHIRKECTKRQYRSYNSGYSLHKSEIFKMLIASKHWIFILVLLATHCLITYNQYFSEKTFSEAVYEEYMTQYAGPLDSDKKVKIQNERIRINEILGNETVMRLSYLNNDISEDEYSAYLKEYRYAYNRNELFKDIEDHVQYVERQQANEKNAWFVYDTGWNHIFFSDFEWTLYAAILIMFAGIFSVEYDRKTSSGGFSQILRTTRHGRKRIFLIKYLTVLCISLLLAVIWNLINISFASISYKLPLGEAPIQSITAFSNIDAELTIFEYLIVYFAVKLIAVVVLSLLVCSLSCICEKFLAVLTTCTVLTLIPAFFSNFGLKIFDNIDFISYMRATPMLIENRTLGYSISIIAVCLLSSYFAKRKWIL